ncbi:ATPase [Candidatus Desantisbacteria bacterium CG1_02_38_46]|uniref:ATPase n=3 Tax=unclassified Candidatus Desantisiibacteriota TaxID=3106372 RepID=A0A2H9PBY3_9BACT|nr:MAG: ATPase [Candidatus Desantisbacteria bacterium CG1_02_38_46]PIU51175.1 MAG: ATPase [Candidatus Desantisbacteria bacterium CG07_land_8_20_14_0_80_39_15]PIZ15580.1 MAG: ATPase [Candidatus Desantisbacteria bacterium CG_4_10_14_0_8_um_filter_39_17]
MDKNEIIRILEDWNFWKRKLDIGITRTYYLDRVKKFLITNQILVILGARRSGKSFIMRQIVNDLIGQGIKSNNILIINFEDPRFIELDAKTLQKIYEVYLEFLNPEEKPYIFLDEVQEVKEWEKWVRMMHELGKAKIIISGSNAKLLSKELATLLTGRHLDLTIFPLSFREYLSFNNIEIKDDLDVINQRNEIKGSLRKYLEFGSFPDVVLSKEKNQILLSYFEDILSKDLIKRFKIRKSEKLKSLAKFYLSNISTLTTFSSIEKFLGISADTVEKFSNYFETAYILFFLKRFSFKVKEQEKSPRKVYSIDSGLAGAVGFRFSENLGRVAENLVFLELKRKQIVNPNLELYYWKDPRHQEVDFLIKEEFNVKQLIQVCWELSRPHTKDREKRILLKTMEEFNLKEGLIITEDEEREEKIDKLRIKIIPLWKWLLA